MTDHWPFVGLAPGSFDFIMADPPWRFVTRSQKGITAKGAGGQYRTMSFADVCALPVGELAAPDCLLWLWTTHPMAHMAPAVLDAWGFTFSTSGVWIKTTKHGKLAFGTGYVLRCASEPFLIAKRGRPKTANNVRTAFPGLIREHSRKPEEGYATAERLMPTAQNRLDLFSRENRPGWTSWGDEQGKFDE